MVKSIHIINNERGSLIVIAVIVLMLLTLIGTSITTTTSTELQIARNDKLHKTAFYEADGGTEIGSEILEQNLGCVGAPGGFSESVIGDDTDEAATPGNAADIKILNQGMWANTSASAASPSNRDFMWPATAEGDPNAVQTNVTVGGNTVLSQGAAIQMSAGYEGKGKGAGGGGGYIAYDMYAHHQGVLNSQSMIMIQWRHVIGQEGACNY